MKSEASLGEVTSNHLEILAGIVGSQHVLADDASRERYGRDETERLHFPPAAVLLPASAAEVSAILSLAHAERLPVTPRGAGTGLSGGALPVHGGLVLSVERMDRIRAIDRRDLVAEVEAGVTDRPAAAGGRGARPLLPARPLEQGHLPDRRQHRRRQRRAALLQIRLDPQIRARPRSGARRRRNFPAPAAATAKTSPATT